MATKERARERERERERESLQDEDKITKDDEVMAWKFLSFAEVNILLEQDVGGVQNHLEEFLNMKHRLISLKEAALLDYYVSGFWWAKTLEFSPVQVGGFLTLLNMLLQNIETQDMSLEENIQELARAMVGIGQSRPERSGGFEFFTADQAEAIIGYLKTSLFQHYTLYEYLFHSPREELVIGEENAVELVKPAGTPFPVPLEEGLPCGLYSRLTAVTLGEEDLTEEVEGVASVEELAEDESLADPLMGYTVEDVRFVLGEITNEIISNVQFEIYEKLQTQEEAYSVRIEKLKKA